MKIKFENFTGHYDEEGVLECIVDNDGKKLTMEIYQEGLGYDFSNTGFMNIILCKAAYVRVMEHNVYIPKYLWIK